ncbi:MAG: FHA domain-containing protein [Candidatus Nanopelagicaceae bacterium]
MVAEPDNKKDLTTTIHLTALRSVESSLAGLIQDAGPELVEVLNGLASDSAMLVSLIGPNKGARFLLNSEATRIGRATDNEIFLDDVTVSRKHAEILRNGKIFSLKDLGSLNGTYLNGALVDEAALSDGDELQVGKFRMHFFTGGKVRS